jgi:Tol biopolymer transport system component
MRSVALNPFWQPYDGSAAPELLAKNQSDLMAASWSPDGKLALVEWKPEKAQQDIVVLDARSGQVTPFLNSSFDEIYPEFSPDGRWLAYTSKEAGRNEVYVQDFPGKRIKRQISSGGGAAPLWARDGKQLYFMHQKNLWAVDVLADAGFAVGKPRLFVTLKSVYLSTTPVRCYDLSQDGQRFLMVKLDQRSPSPATELTLIQNWFKELERLCPAGR